MLTLLIIFATVVQGLIALFVFLKQRNSMTNIIFALLSVSLIGWAGANFFATSVEQNEFAINYIRLVIFFVVIQNTFFYLFSQVFPNKRFQLKPKLFWLYLIFSIVVAGLAMSPFLFTGVVINNGQASPTPGPAMPFFILHAASSVIGAFFSLIKSYRRSTGMSRAQLKYIILGSFVLWIIVPITNFIFTLVFQTNIFPKLSSFYTLVFSSLMAYVIVRHRFLNIRAVVARSVAYVLLTATLGVAYGATIFGFSGIIFTDSAIGIGQQLLYVAIAIVLAFTFQPLKGFFERVTDKLLYRGRYDSQEVLNKLGKVLVSEFRLEELLSGTLKGVCESLGVDNGQFYVFNDEKIYKVEHYGPLPKKLITVPHLKSFRRNLIISDELENGREKAVMDEFGFRAVIKMHTKNEFVGYLLLGDKLNGDIYSTQDIRLIEILAQELAVAISNAKAVEEIAEFNLTLQEKVNNATKRLRAANRHLKELDVAKDEFISMASHQLRTPLTTIKGYLSMLVEGDAGKLTKQQEQFLKKAYNGSQRMADLISDLLSVSRLQAGKFIIVKEPCNLVEVVSEEVEQLHNHATAKNLELRFIPPATRLPLVDLDEGKIRQVIMNFIDNAIYYTQSGSVTVSLGRIGSFAQLTVTDTGIGVPAEAQKHLFGKFYRASNAMNVRPDGTGLGLFLAKRVVEDQGGSIIFKSREGIGSTFGFRFPISTKTSRKIGRKIPVSVRATK